MLDLSVLNLGIVYSILEKKPLKLPEFRLKLIEQILGAHWSDTNVSPCRAGRKQKNDLPLRLTARNFSSQINTGEEKKQFLEDTMSILTQN